MKPPGKFFRTTVLTPSAICMARVLVKGAGALSTEKRSNAPHFLTQKGGV